MKRRYQNLARLSRPQDSRTVIEWATEFVRPPNSARSKSGFDPLQTPWLVEPVNAVADSSLSEIVCLMPTGAGKTTLIDCVIPYTVVEEPDNLILGVQGDEDAGEYVDARLMPILERIRTIKHIMAGMNRHRIKRDCVIFPHMDLYMGGINTPNAQRKSARRVILDEVWLAKPHGIVDQFRARLHDRWNGQAILLSQGGNTHLQTDNGAIETELQAAWVRTDQRLYHFRCPECGEVQRYRLKALKYERSERADGTLDEVGLFQSAKYQCQGRCEQRFDDTDRNRYALSSNGLYVAANPGADPKYRGYQCNALSLHYVPWGKLAVEHAKAHRAKKQGDEEPMRIFRQKRMGENHREEEQQQNTTLTLGDYTFADYLSGELWEGEAVRILTIDVQRDHFWVVVRAWKADGSSRRLWAGRINTAGALREKQETMKVLDQNTFIDAQFDTDVVYNLCGEHHWLGTHGDQADSYLFPAQNKRKFYSPIRRVQGTSGRPAISIHWSNRQIKRILERFRGGYRTGQTWEVEKDITLELHGHLFSEVEKDVINKSTKAVERRFVRIGSRQNHTWDCEAQQVVGALIRGMLVDHPESAKAPKEQTPAPVSTN